MGTGYESDDPTNSVKALKVETHQSPSDTSHVFHCDEWRHFVPRDGASSSKLPQYLPKMFRKFVSSSSDCS